jgi:hypothetical protein
MLKRSLVRTKRADWVWEDDPPTKPDKGPQLTPLRLSTRYCTYEDEEGSSEASLGVWGFPTEKNAQTTAISHQNQPTNRNQQEKLKITSDNAVLNHIGRQLQVPLTSLISMRSPTLYSGTNPPAALVTNRYFMLRAQKTRIGKTVSSILYPS